MRLVAANTFGSCLATHNAFGAVNPGIAMLPVRRRRSGTRFSISVHSANERTSFHRMAGRSGLPAASRKVAPCIWPERPTPASRAKASGALLRSAATPALTASTQSSAFCSLHSGCGRDSDSGTEASATVRCSASISSALTEEVPMSNPRKVSLAPTAMVFSSRRGSRHSKRRQDKRTTPPCRYGEAPRIRLARHPSRA